MQVPWWYHGLVTMALILKVVRVLPLVVRRGITELNIMNVKTLLKVCKWLNDAYLTVHFYIDILVQYSTVLFLLFKYSTVQFLFNF